MSLYIDIQLKRKNFTLAFQANFNTYITGLFGRSGAGKTTLLHILAGLVQPDSGYIRLNDTVLFDSSSHHCLPVRKRQIGLVFQDHLLFPHLTVEGNLKYGQKNTSTKERKQQLWEIAELLDITHLLNRKVPLLSGGEKQRVALGRAILSSPKLLLLDEPFTGLDQELKQQLIPYMRKLYEKTNIPMILVSHSLEEMTELTEELFFIENGKFFAQVSLNKMHAKDRLIGRFCNSDNPTSFQKARNLLVKNHSMQFHSTIIKAV